jgi:DNA-binding protein HU-beta
MNKGDLVAEVSQVADVSKRIATDTIDAVFAAIVRAVANGEKVSLSGFGTFEKRLRAPRTARNPRTGQVLKVPATSVPAFRPGSDFKDAVAGTRRRKK